MFIIKTKEMPATGEPSLLPRRVYVYRDDTIHFIQTWHEDKGEAWNHRYAAIKSLYKSSGIPNFTPHHIIGTAAVPGHDFWVVAVEEGE